MFGTSILTRAALAFSVALPIFPAAAQTAPMVQPVGDADKLADQMRVLATNPRNVEALATAGELSLRLGDLSGAASLFARADQVDPRNGRVKAGMASLLLHSERPGEALRYFGQAEGYGLPPARFAAERGLAYDLVGDQPRAQRDYRVALAAAPDDETSRRLALSLGISGRKDEALAVLEPLLRRKDRGAWRARAFILAMGGDVAGATNIATTMMPGGMAAGLRPFFERLPSLAAVDRAFAVHFGEVHATAQRLADARLAPSMPPLPVSAPVQVASISAPPAKLSASEARRERDRQRREAKAAALAAKQAARTQTALVARQPAPVVEPGAQLASAAPVRAPEALPASRLAPTASRAQPRIDTSQVPRTSVLSDARIRTAIRERLAEQRARPAAAASANLVAAPVQLTAGPPPFSAPIPAPGGTAAKPGFSDAGLGVAPTVSTGLAATRVGATPPPTILPPTTLPAAAAPAAAVSAVQPTLASAAPLLAPATTAAIIAATPTKAPAVEAVPTTERSVAAQSPTRLRRNEDAILARIIAGITVPESELAPLPAPVLAAAAAPPRAQTPEPVKVAQTAPVPRRATATRKDATEEVAAAEASAKTGSRHKLAADASADAETPTKARTRRRGESTEVADDAEPATRKGRRGAASADDTADEAVPTRKGRRGAATELASKDDTSRKGASRRGREADAEDVRTAKGLKGKAANTSSRKDREAERVAKAEPSRIWVQVAGGANEGDLRKAWGGVQGKSKALAGRAGYTTPLRATNRVLTGPFKTDAEARAFVNNLAKQGVSAFPFTSEAGQKITKLPKK